MFDIPPPIEQYCQQETIELVVDTKQNENSDIISNLFNTPEWNPCLNSILIFLFSTLDGTENKEYIRTLLQTASRGDVLVGDTRNIIYENIHLIPYIDDVAYARHYFYLLIALNIKPTPEIKNLEVSDAEFYRHSPLWEKNRYLSYMGDWEAFEYILQKMKLEENPGSVAMMASDLSYHPKAMREKIIEAFKNDPRNIEHHATDQFMLIDNLVITLGDD